MGKSHSKCSSSSSPTFEERVGNHLDKDVMVLSGSGDFNHCNGDSGAFVISDEGISYISGDDQQLAGKTSSYKEELHESETTPEKIRTDSDRRWKVTCNLSEDDSTTQILFEASTLSMDLHLRLKILKSKI